MPFHRLLTFGEKSKRTDRIEEKALPESAALPPDPPAAAAEAAAETLHPDDPAGPFHEKDNQAARIHRLSQADDFWSAYEQARPNIPFLRYVFDTQLQAMEALLSVACIHQAEDTGHLICTEPITIGCYRIADGRYEVFLAGEKLTYPTWSEATEKFSARHGRYRNQLRPETYERFKSLAQADHVVLEKEYYELTLTETKHYQIFRASNFVAAKNFLRQNENAVTAPHHYILVKAPKGTIIRDIDGIHE